MWAPCLTKGKDNKKPLTSGEVPSLRGGEGFFAMSFCPLSQLALTALPRGEPYTMQIFKCNKVL